MFEAFLFYSDNDERDVTNAILISSALVREACYLSVENKAIDHLPTTSDTSRQ